MPSQCSRLALTALCVAAIPFCARAEAESTARASASVRAPISLSKTQDLAFGELAIKAGESVSLNPQGFLSSTGARVKGVSATVATLESRSSEGLSFSISLPVFAALATGAGGPGRSLELSAFKASIGPAAVGSNAVLVSIGATITAVSRPEPGLYQGAFAVSVDYN